MHNVMVLSISHGWLLILSFIGFAYISFYYSKHKMEIKLLFLKCQTFGHLKESAFYFDSDS